MKISREYILSKAFEQYLLRGYSGVSISVLQQQLGIGRATLYYYFKDKNALFCAVIDRFFVKTMEDSLRMPSELLLSEMIETRIELQKKHLLYLKNLNEEFCMSNYSSLMLVALARYPKYGEKLVQLRAQVLEQWKRAISNSIARGEVRSDLDVDIVASLFVNIRDSYESGLQARTKDGVSETTYHYLFDLIKS